MESLRQQSNLLQAKVQRLRQLNQQLEAQKRRQTASQNTHRKPNTVSARDQAYGSAKGKPAAKKAR